MQPYAQLTAGATAAAPARRGDGWRSRALARLRAQPALGYDDRGSPATEPTAWAALALISAGDARAAERPLAWLVEQQSPDGSLGVTAEQPEPRWPTPLAVLAWAAWQRATGQMRFRGPIRRAVAWQLSAKGRQIPRYDEGHDGMLLGWPWVAGTHSWIEPTALALLALKATGNGGHPRAREAVRLLIDRLLESGGCNYGNTFVLGQQLRPHLQPTGLAMLALAGQRDPSGRIEASLAYLRRELASASTPASLSYVLLGLAAHGQSVEAAPGLLRAAAGREPAAYKRALLVLAAAGADGLLVRLARGQTT